MEGVRILTRDKGVAQMQQSAAVLKISGVLWLGLVATNKDEVFIFPEAKRQLDPWAKILVGVGLVLTVMGLGFAVVLMLGTYDPGIDLSMAGGSGVNLIALPLGPLLLSVGLAMLWKDHKAQRMVAQELEQDDLQRGMSLEQRFSLSPRAFRLGKDGLILKQRGRWTHLCSSNDDKLSVRLLDGSSLSRLL